MHFARILMTSVAAIAIAGCASTPDVKVSYYLPTTDISIHVVRTVGCDTASNVITTSTVTTTVANYADRTKLHAIALKDLDGTFSDTDFQIQLYDDGRLKAINGASTGEAEATIKPMLALATTVLPIVGLSPGTKAPTACAFSSDPTKPVTVAFTRHLDFQKLAGTDGADAQNIEPDPDYAAAFGRTSQALGYTCVKIERLGSGKAYLPGEERSSDPGNTVDIDLVQPAPVGLKVFRAASSACNGVVSDDNTIWSGQGLVAQLGQPYKLPIPKARLFGKLQFNLALSEAGAITTLQYTKQSAAAVAATAANEIAGGAAPETAAQKAADLKSESDLIAQQQRLIRCQTNPKSCT